MFNDMLAMGNGGGGTPYFAASYSNVSGEISETIGFEPKKVWIMRPDYSGNHTMMWYYDESVSSTNATFYDNGSTSSYTKSTAFTYSSGVITFKTNSSDNHVYVFVEG